MLEAPYSASSKPRKTGECATIRTQENQKILIDSFVDAVRQWRNRSRAAQELHGMSDRQLSDIGIARGDIENVVSGRLVRAPRQRHSAVRQRRHAGRADRALRGR
ncbi:MAG: hypothetical protein CMM31_05115 [Rhodospirillaceae bacterium]|nr:hypothetical protein [Rhodospirillaceae bacterium]